MSLKEILELEPEIEEIEEEKVEEVTETEEITQEEEPKGEVKEEPKEEVKPEKTAEEFARERRERVTEAKRIKEAERRAEEAEARAAALEAQLKPEEKEGVDVHPDLIELVEDKKFERAGREFSALEEEFKRSAPSDFDEVSMGYKVALYNSIRLDNPRMGHDALLKETNRKLLLKASSYYTQGLNPIEEMYHDAKALGLRYSEPKQETTETKERKPDLAKVAENQKRSSGMAGAPGRGTAAFNVTEGMTIAEWSKALQEKRV